MLPFLCYYNVSPRADLPYNHLAMRLRTRRSLVGFGLCSRRRDVLWTSSCLIWRFIWRTVALVSRLNEASVGGSPGYAC